MKAEIFSKQECLHLQYRHKYMWIVGDIPEASCDRIKQTRHTSANLMINILTQRQHDGQNVSLYAAKNIHTETVRWAKCLALCCKEYWHRDCTTGKMSCFMLQRIFTQRLYDGQGQNVSLYAAKNIDTEKCKQWCNKKNTKRLLSGF